eukprot:CAMPEP_0184351854 /NCGR_PEP_ID=MMETSP1089-20130417/55132_1 /TAXON_ID=38269 ORGANISM="Gloeochaete wittrockiana, Strain SAG46.84" /NCGR_SAMPLE_ID=MMETSP1089 /ASSEMBLY_ACC=CAM_ASM_000445 /LENGTH=95 /DNA_ID=CAMNT_0026685673 /DNA_START=274 /DNA_END=564 /DNA_ORIENTATION=-
MFCDGDGHSFEGSPNTQYIPDLIPNKCALAMSKWNLESENLQGQMLALAVAVWVEKEWLQRWGQEWDTGGNVKGVGNGGMRGRGGEGRSSGFIGI